MKNNKIKLVLIAVILVITATVNISCTDNNIDTYGKFSLKLSDAPLDYDQFKEANITIEKVQIRKANGDFITLMDNPNKSNLLELINGITETLIDIDLPEGNYDMIRLFMTGSEMVMANGSTYTDEMDFGNFSGNNIMGSGMMMNEEMNSIDIEFDTMLSIMEGFHEEFLLDVDVNQSFMLEGINYTNMGSGMMMDISGFEFNPIMRFVQMSTAGTISGKVQGDDGFLKNATVTLMQSGKAYTSTHTDKNGNYKLIGIPQGDYSIVTEMKDFIMNSDQNESVMGEFAMMSQSTLQMNFYLSSVN